MRQRVGPGVIVIGVVVVLGLVFAIYKISFAPAPNNIKADNAPGYMKPAGAQSGGASSSSSGGEAPVTGRPSYGQGSGYEPGGAAMGGRPSYAPPATGGR